MQSIAPRAPKMLCHTAGQYSCGTTPKFDCDQIGGPCDTGAAGTTWIRRLALIPPIALGAALIWQALSVQPDPPVVPVVERSVPVSFVTATPRTVSPRISGYGTVTPGRVWSAVAQVSGPVAYLHPSFVRGGTIGTGEVLLRIASEDYDLALERAAADLAGAEAQIEELVISKRTTTAALAIETEALALAQADLERTDRLATKGAVAASIVETKQRDLLAQRAKVQSLEATLALLPAQIATLEQSAAVARVAKRTATLDLERTIIRAPFDARVASADVQVSQFVAAGTVMGVLDGIRVAEVDVQLSQRRLTNLARLAGNRAERAVSAPVSPAGLQGRSGLYASSMDPRHLSARLTLGPDEGGFSWRAEVDRIAESAVAETRSIGVIVQVREPYASTGQPAQPPLVKGMFVRVDLTAPPMDGVIVLPRAAIRNGQVMLVGADDRLAFRTVRVLYTQDDISMIAPDALPPGARVVTSAPSPAIEGLLLSPAPDVLTEARLAAMTEENAL